MLPAIILFAATYVLMLTFSKFRLYIVLASGLIFIISGMLALNEILPYLEFNILLMIGGTMGLLVGLFLMIGGIGHEGGHRCPVKAGRRQSLPDVHHHRLGIRADLRFY